MPKNRKQTFSDMQAEAARMKKLAKLNPVASLRPSPVPTAESVEPTKAKTKATKKTKSIGKGK